MNLKKSFLVRTVGVGTTISLFGSSIYASADKLSFFKDMINNSILGPLCSVDTLKGSDENHLSTKFGLLSSLVNSSDSFDELLAILSVLPEKLEKINFDYNKNIISFFDEANGGNYELNEDELSKFISEFNNRDIKEELLKELNDKIKDVDIKKGEKFNVEFLDAIDKVKFEHGFSKFFYEKAKASKNGPVVLKKEDLENFDRSVYGSIFENILKTVKSDFDLYSKYVEEKLKSKEVKDGFIGQLEKEFDSFKKLIAVCVKKDYSKGHEKDCCDTFNKVLDKVVEINLFFNSFKSEVCMAIVKDLETSNKDCRE